MDGHSGDAEVLLQTSNSHSPISCANCRRAHRRCDRKLPECTECSQRETDIKCSYNTPRKRGPKTNVHKKRKSEVNEDDEAKVFVASDNITMQPTAIKIPVATSPALSNQHVLAPKIEPPSPTSFSPTTTQPSCINAQTSSVEEMKCMSGLDQLTPLHRHHLHDIYYEWVSIGYSIIDRQSVDIFLHSHFPYATPTIALDCPMTVAEEARLAFVESIEITVLQRIGCKLLAQQLFLVLRQRMGKFFDQSHLYYDLAAAMMHVCTYLSGDGEFQQSNIYFALTGEFLKAERIRQESNIPLVSLEHYKALSGFYDYCSLINMTDTLAKISGVGKLFYNMYFNAIFDDSALDPTRYTTEFDYLRAILDLIDALETRTKVFHYHAVKAPQQVLTQSMIAQFTIGDVHYEFMIQGIRLSIFIKTGLVSLDLAKQIADRVASITRSPWLEKCSMLAIDPVANAARVHLHDPQVPLATLEQDLSALRLLHTRFNATRRLYGGVIDMLSERIYKTSGLVV